MTPKEALKKYFGYDAFRPGQEEIIDLITGNKNVLAVLPTGAGKSLCYQIPALLGKSYSIVLSPLIALMKDQVDILNKDNHIASFINSSLDFNETQKVLNDVRNSRIKLLYVAPERLLNNNFIDLVTEYPPDYFFIDEAHCISEWGHNFRPNYRKIQDFTKHLKIEKISAFTATATPEVRLDILKQLSIENAKIIVRGFERENLSLRVVKTRQKKEKAVKLLKQFGTPAIIYTATRKTAEEVSEYLRLNGIKSSYYHAGLAAGVRTIIQDDFLNNRIDVITATNAFGMGIDKENIRLIIHTNIPSSIESYYQEIGRAGRDGKESNIVLFFEPKDKQLQEFLINNSYPSREQIAAVYDAIFNYAEVAIGLKRDDLIVLDDNFMKLVLVKGISETIISGSLRLLENSGYIEIATELNQNHYMRFALSTDQLQAYVKKLGNSALKDLILTLLRFYGSDAFVRNIKLNFTDLTEKLSLEKSSLKEMLLTLSSIGIIEYLVPTSDVKIKLSKTRIPSRMIELTREYDILKQTALSRLEEMVKFIDARECRFKFILEYFGETVGNYKCGKCDICTGMNESVSEISDYIEEIIINTLHEVKAKLRERDIISILRGHSPSGKLKNYSSFGTCVHFSKEELKTVLQSLVNKGFLKEVDEHIVLTDSGTNLFTKFDTIKEEDVDDNIDKDGTLDLFHELRKLRLAAAKKFSQPEELICSDEILKRISEKKPDSLSTLQSIEGVTQRLLNKFGDEIIQLIVDFTKRRELISSSNKNQVPESLASVLKLITSGYNLEEISGLLKLSDHLIAVQIESLLKLDPEIDISKLISKKNSEVITRAIESGIVEMKELKSVLPEYITYSQIRIVKAKNRV